VVLLHLPRIDGDPQRQRRLLVWTLVALVLIASSTVFASRDNGDLWFFTLKYHEMLRPGGLHVYAQSTNTQTGPISLLLVGAIDSIEKFGYVLLPIVNGLLCAMTLWCLWRLDGVRSRSLPMFAACALLLIGWWWPLSQWGHPDDALVLTVAVASLLLVQRDRRLAGAVLIGLALAVKPWALFLLPMTLEREGTWRRRLAGPALSTAVGALCWSPFLLTSLDSLDGLRPAVFVAPDSVFGLLTGQPGVTPPAVLRLAQLGGGLALATWSAWRGRVSCLLLGAIAIRLMLDAATWDYYTVGLVLGAAVWDLTESKRRVPWLTIAVTLLVPPHWGLADPLRGAMRLIATAGCLVIVVARVRGGRASHPVGAGTKVPGKLPAGVSTVSV
jgi:hypothetical protein